MSLFKIKSTMNITITPHCFSKNMSVPASKSHTIRRLLIAALAGGVSSIVRPLDSLDARSCASICGLFGAGFKEKQTSDGHCWVVQGIGGAEGIKARTDPLDVGNSGTTLFFALAIAALSKNPITFTGDDQIARRSAAPLLNALAELGVDVESRSGHTPITVRGPLKSGRVSLECPTSQYLSALLLAAPLSAAGTVIEIDIPLLNERPYIEMTLSYLDAQKIEYETNADFSYFKLKGGAHYKPVSGLVAGDFSSAAFPALAAAISGGTLTINNLDPADSQGDKLFFDILKDSGCGVEWLQEDSMWKARVFKKDGLRGFSRDLNATPDLFPACAVLGAFSRGTTRLFNVAHARIKETDRIAVMSAELSKLGVSCREFPDGIEIKGFLDGLPQHAIALEGHGDHRVVMALACAGLALPNGVAVSTAEAADVTYPGFFKLI